MPGKQRRILFQSSGVARNRDGYAVGKAATSIQALDFENNLMTTVLEDERYDFLLPKMSTDGYLYYIRRPYEINRYRPEMAILDFFLFPFRLIRAIFHYLNFFSLVYSQKPLTTASGPKMQSDDMKTIILKGKIIDAEKALRKGARIIYSVNGRREDFFFRRQFAVAYCRRPTALQKWNPPTRWSVPYN
jgi:hypothetical protein